MLALRRSIGRVRQSAKLLLPPNEWDAGRLRRGRELDKSRRFDRAQALEREFAQVLESGCARSCGPRGGANQDLAGVGVLLEASGDVDAWSNRHPLMAFDGVEVHQRFAGFNPDSNGESLVATT